MVLSKMVMGAAVLALSGSVEGVQRLRRSETMEGVQTRLTAQLQMAMQDLTFGGPHGVPLLSDSQMEHRLAHLVGNVAEDAAEKAKADAQEKAQAEANAEGGISDDGSEDGDSKRQLVADPAGGKFATGFSQAGCKDAATALDKLPKCPKSPAPTGSSLGQFCQDECSSRRLNALLHLVQTQDRACLSDFFTTAMGMLDVELEKTLDKRVGPAKGASKAQLKERAAMEKFAGGMMKSMGAMALVKAGTTWVQMAHACDGPKKAEGTQLYCMATDGLLTKMMGGPQRTPSRARKPQVDMIVLLQEGWKHLHAMPQGTQIASAFCDIAPAILEGNQGAVTHKALVATHSVHSIHSSQSVHVSQETETPACKQMLAEKCCLGTMVNMVEEVQPLMSAVTKMAGAKRDVVKEQTAMMKDKLHAQVAKQCPAVKAPFEACEVVKFSKSTETKVEKVEKAKAVKVKSIDSAKTAKVAKKSQK